MIIMGVNAYLSYDKYRFVKLSEYYSKWNLRRYCKRIMPAFVMVWIISLIFGLVMDKTYFGWKNILGLLPTPAPGNAFLTTILEGIIIVPLLVYFYRKYPKYSLIALFAISLVVELCAPLIFKTDDNYFYYSFIFRVLSMIGIGFYIGKRLIKNRVSNIIKNEYFQVGLFISTLYLVVYAISDFKIPCFLADLETQNTLSVFYPALLVILMLMIKVGKFENNIVYKTFRLIGKSSYHIFLFQMLYFSFRWGSYEATNITLFKAILINIIITIVGGVVFYYFESWLMKRINNASSVLSRIGLA
jgi:hypothetical protein